MAEPTEPLAHRTSPGSGTLPFDPWRIVVAVARRRWVLAVGAGAAGVLAAAAGWLRFETHSVATVQIIRREVPNSFRASDLGESFKPRQFSAGTVTAMMQSPSLLASVGAQARPRISGARLGSSLEITPERNTDLITITLTIREPRAVAAALINLYAERVVELTKTLQAQEAAELEAFLREQLDQTERDLSDANRALLAFSRESNFFSAEKEAEVYLRALNEAELRVQSARLERETLDFRIAAAERELAQQDARKLKLTEARDALEALRGQYTDLNPLVIEQQARVAALERQVATNTNAVAEFQAGPNTVANSLYLDLVNYQAQRAALDQQFPQLEAYRTNLLARLQGVPEKNLLFAKLKARQTSLEITRDLLAGRQREAQLFAEKSPGYYRLFAPTTPEQVGQSSRTRKILLVTVAGVLLGAGLALLVVAFLEILDDRLVSPGDVRRVTGCPLLATLGPSDALADAELAVWRFRTWSVLQHQLRFQPDTGAVLGLLSARAGEGRSLWIHGLEAAATERGWRTVTVVNRLPPGDAAPPIPIADALAFPDRVLHAAEQAGRATVRWEANWVWDSPRRAQWQAAVRGWRSTPGLAILVELPPADRLESVMLAETLPHVLWLSESGGTRSSEVSALLTTLRLARVPVHGAVLNRLPSIWTRWPVLSRGALIGGCLLAMGLGLAGSALAADAPAAGSPQTNVVLSGLAAGPRLAPWQERLTLGPGDLVNLAVYGQKQLTRTEVPVGPDGRISYLQASGVMAAGLTVDELRDKLTEELSRFRRNARVIVTPFAWRSKKYYLLGTIMDRGTYYLDQPITIIEATARARGIATGLLEQNTVEIADLPRTFLIRRGQRMPVDFVKLFQQGDLSQNILLEPGDYIYFPSATVNEVYVLGAVDSPGTVGVTEKASVISVITTRGGFAPKAYKQRVLVVRGSLNNPETHVINVAAILGARATDFRVEPKDIIYVADRPWARAEELLDMAIKAFVVTATAEWVNQNVGPIITEPILPSP